MLRSTISVRFDDISVSSEGQTAWQQQSKLISNITPNNIQVFHSCIIKSDFFLQNDETHQNFVSSYQTIFFFLSFELLCKSDSKFWRCRNIEKSCQLKNIEKML